MIVFLTRVNVKNKRENVYHFLSTQVHSQVIEESGRVSETTFFRKRFTQEVYDTRREEGTSS